MNLTSVEIENTREARRAPPGQYRVMWTARSAERSGLYYIGDCSRAEVALKLAEVLGFKDGNGIVETHSGLILYPCMDGGAQLFTREKLLKTFGRTERRERGTTFLTEAHVEAIEADQPNRLPGWQPGDQLLVHWDDIAKATGAEAHPGDLGY